MDQYKTSKDEKAPAPAGPKPGPRPGTGNLNADSFQSSGTGPLGKMGTRKLASGPLETEKTLQSMTAEVENGTVILGKLEGRIAVLARAFQIAEKPVDAPKILAGIGAGEANFTKQVAQSLMQDPTTKRRVQVATYQFEQAKKGIEQAQALLDRAAQYDGVAKGQFVDNNIFVEKLRGQLYPLINLHMVFKDHPQISQLIPTPKIQAEEPPPPPPPPPQPAQKAPTGPLGTGALAEDPAVREVVDTLQRVTGNLKEKFTGLFKKG